MLKKMQDRITYNFLLAGHTKFTLDRCFGQIKQNYRRWFVSLIFDVATPVNNSAGVNLAKFCGLPNCEVLVPVYDWQNFFEKYFRRIPDILSDHRFEISIDEPGIVVCRKYVDSEPKRVEVFRGSTIPSGLPEKIAPTGLSEQRKSYLFKEIRKYCRKGTKISLHPIQTNTNLGKQKLVKK